MMADPLHKQRYRQGELARALGKHISTVVRWTQRGVRGRVLRSYLMGGQRYIDREDVLAFLDAINGFDVSDTASASPSRADEKRRVDDALDQAGI